VRTMVRETHPNGHGKHATIMKLAMTVSPYPTFPRKREKEQMNRYASFTFICPKPQYGKF